MSKGLKIKLLISLSCILIVVCSIFCLSACTKSYVKAYLDTGMMEFEKISQMLSLIPVKQGYSFDGWVYYVNDEPIKVTRDSIPEDDKSVIFYPSWKPIEYTVTFFADGNEVGKGTYTIETPPTMPAIPEKSGYTAMWEEHEFTTGDVEINAVYAPKTYNITYENLCGAQSNNASTYTYGTSYTFANPERLGYVFNGWLDREGNKVEQITKDTYGDLILSADWGPISYTITYTNTKNADLCNIPTEYSAETGSFSLPKISADGYNFAGWYNTEGKVDKIESGTKGNLIFEARWNPINYTISYLNTKDSVNTNPDSYSVESGEIKLSAPLAGGYTFEGWYNGSEKVESIPEASKGNITLEARWTAIVYRILYTNTKDVANDNPTEYSRENSGFSLTALQAEGYNFDGWYMGNTKVETFPENVFGDKVLDARWSPIMYTISYLNTKDAVNTNPSEYSVESDTIKLSSPFVEGYIFDGWYEGNEKVESISQTSKRNITLEAHWTVIDYVIRYINTKGAENTNPTEYSIENSGFSLTALQSEGYNFDGWYLGNTKVETFPENIIGEKTLEARWSPIMYNIMYTNINGAVNDNPTEYSVESGNIQLKPPVADGYNFEGWYKGSEKVDVIPENSKGDITLEAAWSVIVYSITYTNTKCVVNANPIEYTSDKGGFALTALQAEGYNFDGWYLGNTKLETFPENVAGEKTLEARWTPINYSISYYNVENAINENRITYTVEDTNFNLGVAVRPWYDFKGWYSDASLTQEVETINTSDMKNISLYAAWSLATYKARFYDGTNLIFSQQFNLGTTKLDNPELPEIQGYTAAWNEYTLTSSDMDIFSKYTPTLYNITYLNTKDADLSNIVKDFTIESSTITLTSLELGGYNFLGWYDGDQLVTEIEKGSIGNREFTARWETAVYSITYENMKNAEVSDITYSYTIESDAIALPADLSVDGYSFVGWNDENGEKIDHIAKGSFGNRVLTAVFNPIEYTIVYEEVADCVNENQSTYTIESGLVLKPLSRFGYSFLGWYSEDVVVTEIQVGEYGNRTLKAKWGIATYKITYENTKGYDTSAFVSEYTMESPKIVLPIELPVDGYTFNGWKDVNGNKVEAIEQGSSGDVVFTADLTPIIYSISYKDTTDAINSNPINYSIEDSIKLNSLQRRGYSFVGWFRDDELVSSIDVGTFGNITLTAKWELALYKITYTGTYGADTSNFVSYYTIESKTIKLPVDLKVSGYTFNGWKDESGAIVTEIINGSYGDIVLTADLLPTKYVITLEAMDGSVSKQSVSVLYGQDFTLPVPTFANGTFLGWYNNTGDDAMPMTDDKGNSIKAYPYRSSRTFYAHYSIDVFTITFDPDGGTPVSAQNYTSGSHFMESKAYTELSGYLFEGWFDSNNTKYSDGTPITASVVLRAKWTKSVGISDLDGLLAIAENPSGNYHLLNDINLKGNIWTPIDSFSGVFDGKGYALKNFNLSCTTQTPSFAFIKVNEGTIKNVCFADFTFNISISSLEHITSALVVAENNGVLENCVVSTGLIKLNFVAEYNWSVTMNKIFGTFVGKNGEIGIVKNCRSMVGITVTISVYNSRGEYSGADLIQNIYCGGIAGINSGLIENCNYNSTINISDHARSYRHYSHNCVNAGGIVGENSAGGKCNNCYANVEFILKTTRDGGSSTNYMRAGGIVGINGGDITSSRSSGSLSNESTGNDNLGGLVGYNVDKANVVSSYSSTKITTNQSGSTGGFVGYNAGIIQNSYAKGSVTSTSDGNVAGFVGNNGATGSISKCYSNGSVASKSGNVGYFVGASSGTLFKCFYLSSAPLTINGQPQKYFTEYETVEGLLNQTLWSKDFLVDEMYWEEEGWIILTNDNPMLNWEISLDDYDVVIKKPDCVNVGYSLYVEKNGNRFFIRNFVEAWGHSYDYSDVKVVLPTCITKGYEEYKCIICNHIERMNYTDSTGHTTGEMIDHNDPNCVDIGYTIYSCVNCHEEIRTEIPALGHTPNVTVAGVSPTCGINDNGIFYETEGFCDRIECSVCNVVLQEQTKILPHNYVLTVTTTEATCDTDGLGTFTCSYENCGKHIERVIPKLGHADINKDYICDNCKKLCIYDENDNIIELQNVIEIKTAADLLNISSNLNGVYRLMNDIDMNNTNWMALGTDEKPFTGFIDGNGKAIKNLHGADNSYVPMFGYLRGILHGLTLNYVNGITVNLSENGKAGLLAEINDGTIIDCKISGTVNVKFSYIKESSELKDLSQTAMAVFGGLVYTNNSEGVILNSTVAANFKVTYEHKYSLNLDWSLDTVINREYRYQHSSVFNIYFGAIAGINGGTIRSCSSTQFAEYREGDAGAATAKVKDCNGHVFVTTNVYLEGITAINNMTVDNCSSMLSFQGTGLAGYEDVRHVQAFWTEKETFNIIMK